MNGTTHIYVSLASSGLRILEVINVSFLPSLLRNKMSDSSRKERIASYLLAVTTFFFLIPTILSQGPVKLKVDGKHVIIDNGLLQLTLTNPEGYLAGVSYNGIDNILQKRNKESGRAYWDLVWHDDESRGFVVIGGEKLKVIAEDDDRVEVSFTTTSWNPNLKGKSVPLNIDKRFIVLRNLAGFYTYAIYDHKENWPGFALVETRIAFKLREDKFHHMAVTDTRQLVMPMPQDRDPPRGEQLDYVEAVLLVDPTNPELQGQVDDKYQYSIDNKDSQVHGWMSTNPPTGFWVITPTYEFRTGGPMKQSLTSHTNPISLAVFSSGHYAGDDLVPNIGDNEPWKKVFGPIFVYLNSGGSTNSMWEDAKSQMTAEVKKWPYEFVASEDFPKSNQRGSASGRLLVNDRYVSSTNSPAKAAYVGLALPGPAGSWQRECKGYQFWTQTDSNGNFKIENVRAGVYNLYGWVPGFIGDYKYEQTITVKEGSAIALGDLVYSPPRSGPTLWEIGVPDRTAAEFYVPDPDPRYANKLYLNIDRFRQYGLWRRYGDLYPNGDLVFTVGISDHRKDWFYAHLTRQTRDNTYEPTTWQIKFDLDNVNPGGTYMLRIAVASATFANLRVQVNEKRGQFSTGRIGKDNSIARHGIHGLYSLYSFNVQGSMLRRGTNTIYLTQTNGGGKFPGLMYDYLRLEGPRT